MAFQPASMFLFGSRAGCTEDAYWINSTCSRALLAADGVGESIQTAVGGGAIGDNISTPSAQLVRRSDTPTRKTIDPSSSSSTSSSSPSSSSSSSSSSSAAAATAATAAAAVALAAAAAAAAATTSPSDKQNPASGRTESSAQPLSQQHQIASALAAQERLAGALLLQHHQRQQQQLHSRRSSMSDDGLAQFQGRRKVDEEADGDAKSASRALHETNNNNSLNTEQLMSVLKMKQHQYIEAALRGDACCEQDDDDEVNSLVSSNDEFGSLRAAQLHQQHRRQESRAMSEDDEDEDNGDGQEMALNLCLNNKSASPPAADERDDPAQIFSNKSHLNNNHAINGSLLAQANHLLAPTLTTTDKQQLNQHRHMLTAASLGQHLQQLTSGNNQLQAQLNHHLKQQQHQHQQQQANSRLYHHLNQHLSGQALAAAAAAAAAAMGSGQAACGSSSSLSSSSSSNSSTTSPPSSAAALSHLLSHHNHNHHHHHNNNNTNHHSHQNPHSASLSSASSSSGSSSAGSFSSAASWSADSLASSSCSPDQRIPAGGPVPGATGASNAPAGLQASISSPLSAAHILAGQASAANHHRLNHQARPLFFAPHHHQPLHQQHELGPLHKADSDDLDRIRSFIEQFKARRGALGLTQKQAAQCFRAYTNDRYAFSDNFVGHFEGFQFRPQTAMTIADSLAEWLEFAESETRQGRQLSFMPGKVKETRKRKYEVIRIRDSAKRVLVEAFEKNRSPSTSELELLSKKTNIPSRNIEIFFKNRRTSRQYHH